MRDFDLADTMEAWAEADKRKSHRCQCGDDLPGKCPGPVNCPYSSVNSDEDDEVSISRSYP